MATEAQYQATRRGAGSAAQVLCSKVVAFTVNGNTTVKDSTITLPAGSTFHSITLDTPTAISGTPTTCNFRAGIADTGATIVADVDAKGQGHIACTIVAALNKISLAASADTPLFLQVTTSGGTASAGTIYAIVNYSAPAF